MAFATTNPKSMNLGGGLRLYWGGWTGATGDAAGSLTVQGGTLVFAFFRATAAGDPAHVVPVSSAAGSADNTRTLTVYNNQDVTVGSYVVMTAG